MLVFIGTLHGGLTPEDELIKLIESFSPSRLLIEMTQDDIEHGRTERYPSEMRAALTWATNTRIVVRGIDSSIKTTKEGVSDEAIKRLAEEQTAIISRHDWKEFNKPEFYTALQTRTWHEIVDSAKDTERNIAIYDNITRETSGPEAKVTIVITGSGHIPFFRRKFPAARFPLS